MTPDTIRKTTMRDENDTNTADLLRTVTTELESDKAGRAEFTVAGFGTGTVAEIEYFIAGIIDERDALRKDAASPTTNAALALYDAVSLATNAALVDLISDVEAQADDISDLRAELRSAAGEIRDLRRELGDVDTAGEIDGAAIWAEISDRVDESAAESARQVIRDELVASVDLI
jgi:hypothetical protein